MARENHIILGVGAVVFHQGCVLLVKRSNPPFNDQWAIPGGKVCFGEPLREAAEREIKEETGIIIKAGEPIFTFEVIETEIPSTAIHYVVIDLEARYVSGIPRAHDDAAEAAWIDARTMNEIDVNQITRELLGSKYNFPA